MKDCPAIVKVTVEGFEKDYSSKLARIISKSALDALSLLLGGRSLFLQQALFEERLGPIRTHRLVETNGNLWLPGSGLSDRVTHFSRDRIEGALTDIAPFIPALAAVMTGLLSPNKHPHPKLVMRWATALDWFGESCREASDAVAIAKLGTSLDVLSNGGKFIGIANMVSSLLETEGDTLVIKGDKPQTLNQLMKQIYDDGRSKVLHGTYYDRLETLQVERQHAYEITRHALIAAVMSLFEYKGTDCDKAFRNMRPS
ncbi:hypothetical protein PO25_17095 [Vibrio anguillarum]|uniref:HEPN domain-containing protein n=1 Tax=Vibrio anguillarum TaxID=55601 RepID=UPI001C05A749|nr:HEPN domain-containing protein [Vibrio anguillarum]MBT2949600.1 hypothetical protein [Vibrio anguillarum]